MRIVILGAGFGGLELAARLSERVGDELDCTLIDQGDAFVFGFAKLDLLFGKTSPRRSGSRTRGWRSPACASVRRRSCRSTRGDAGRHRPRDLRRRRARRRARSRLRHRRDARARRRRQRVLLIRRREAGRDRLPAFTSGNAVVGVCGQTFKCPPAPSEAAICWTSTARPWRTGRDQRDAGDAVRRTDPALARHVPGAPGRFAELDIRFVAQHRVASYDPTGQTVALDDGSELPCDVFLAIPVHRAPDVVEASGLAVNGSVPVDHSTLATRFSDVYGVGDVADVGTAKAGVFAEGAARVVADHLIASPWRRRTGRLRRRRDLLRGVRRRPRRQGEGRLLLRSVAHRRLLGSRRRRSRPRRPSSAYAVGAGSPPDPPTPVPTPRLVSAGAGWLAASRLRGIAVRACEEPGSRRSTRPRTRC